MSLPNGVQGTLFDALRFQRTSDPTRSAIFQTVSLDSTLAIEPHGKAHLFAFLGCPLDFSRVGVGARPAKSYRCLHRPNSPPLWCLRGGVGGDGTRRWPKRERLSDPADWALGVMD